MNSQSTLSQMINSYPQNLLDANTEISLGRDIQLGIKSQNALNVLKNGTEKEKEELKTSFSNLSIDILKRNVEYGKQAEENLIEHNIKLVMYVAKQFAGYHFEMTDLIQEGMLGCMTAAKKYNPELGFRFSTCAVPWIRQQISRFIQSSRRTIRLPAHVSEALSKLNKLSNAYAQEHNGELPTNQQLVELSDNKFTLENIELYKSASQPIASLNAVVGDEQDTEFGDLIPDENGENPEDYSDGLELRDNLEKLIDTLPDVQQKVIRLRYGLNDESREYTLEEIGDKLGYTRERIRQFEDDARLTMKVRAKGTGLEAFMDK